MEQRKKRPKLESRLAEAARTDSRRIHITTSENGWVVVKESLVNPSRREKTQKEAIAWAVKYAARTRNVSKVIVHGKDGRVLRSIPFAVPTREARIER